MRQRLVGFITESIVVFALDFEIPYNIDGGSMCAQKWDKPLSSAMCKRNLLIPVCLSGVENLIRNLATWDKKQSEHCQSQETNTILFQVVTTDPFGWYDYNRNRT